MAAAFQTGDCVRLADGRVARVREQKSDQIRVRVRRPSGKTDQFLLVDAEEIKRVDCPQGWMSPDGYRRYLDKTLAKMEERKAKS